MIYYLSWSFYTLLVLLFVTHTMKDWVSRWIMTLKIWRKRWRNSCTNLNMGIRCCQYLWILDVASISEFLVLPVYLKSRCCQYLWVLGVASISEIPVLPVSLSQHNGQKKDRQYNDQQKKDKQWSTKPLHRQLIEQHKPHTNRGLPQGSL
jgi:hypothetical protein